MSRVTSLRLTRAVVRFARPRIPDLAGTVRTALTVQRSIFPKAGAIAVGVGSRGVANLAEIVKTSVVILQ
ncbi:MAG: hypothetical protein ABI634_17825, partial [Acidobacteriota bacterium]